MQRAIVTLAMIFGLGIAPVADASFVLQMGLGSPTTVGTQVTIPINVVFTSTNLNPGEDFVDFVFLDLSLSSSELKSPLLPSALNFSRFSFTDTLSGWQFLGLDNDNGTVGFIGVTDKILPSASTRLLANMVIDITGLNSGTFTASIFRAGSTTATGSIEDTFVGDFTTQQGTNLDAPGSASFNITAVPEPTSFIPSAMLAAALLWKWRKARALTKTPLSGM